MAFKHLHLLSLSFIVLISSIAHSIRDLPSDQKPYRHHFVKDLQGCRKGDSTKGLNKLKHYLNKFGYVKYSNLTHLNNDHFDDPLESALKTYQQNFHIPPTGVVDAATVSKIALPRCGVPDIVNSVNTMHRKKHHGHSSKSKSIPNPNVANYAFFPFAPRWPASQTHLTYSFDSTTPPNAMTPVANAFKKWETATQYFTFSQAESDEDSNLVIGFYSGDHNDGSPFDGPSGILAHAFAPTDGNFHYDADETWSTKPDFNSFDLESVALHEIGHLLGLGHSTVETAVMHPGIAPGETRLEFDEDDLYGIRTLYDLGN